MGRDGGALRPFRRSAARTRARGIVQIAAEHPLVGRDPNGDVLRVIVELHADLLVITVYRGDE